MKVKRLPITLVMSLLIFLMVGFVGLGCSAPGLGTEEDQALQASMYFEEMSRTGANKFFVADFIFSSATGEVQVNLLNKYGHLRCEVYSTNSLASEVKAGVEKFRVVLLDKPVGGISCDGVNGPSYNYFRFVPYN